MRCDIIVAVWNQLDVTRQCFESLVKNTDCPYRLIIIDNASDNTTKDFLDKFSASSGLDAKIIRNAQNLGFTKAINQGFAISDADFVCVLNNDTLLTKGWLSELVNIAESHDKIGIINPSSNNLGERLMKGETAEWHNKKLSKDKGRYAQLDSCIGFCMLIKRAVIDKIGFFDEVYSPGNFEDTDYCRRAQQADFICVRARGVYVHHFERTSHKLCRDADILFKKNQNIFYERWGKTKRLLYIIKEEPISYTKLKKEIFESIKPGVYVSIFCDKDLPSLFNEDDYFNLAVFKFSRIFFSFDLLGKILFKKKKFDKIFVFNNFYFTLLKLLQKFHRAEVLFQNG